MLLAEHPSMFTAGLDEEYEHNESGINLSILNHVSYSLKSLMGVT